MEIKVRNKLVEVSETDDANANSELFIEKELITRGIYNETDDANAMHAHTSIK